MPPPDAAPVGFDLPGDKELLCQGCRRWRSAGPSVTAPAPLLVFEPPSAASGTVHPSVLSAAPCSPRPAVPQDAASALVARSVPPAAAADGSCKPEGPAPDLERSVWAARRGRSRTTAVENRPDQLHSDKGKRGTAAGEPLTFHLLVSQCSSLQRVPHKWTFLW